MNQKLIGIHLLGSFTGQNPLKDGDQGEVAAFLAQIDTLDGQAMLARS